MSIGSLFLSLGIKGDTKSLDEAIEKVKKLKEETKALNDALKATKDATKIGGVGGGSTRGSTKSPELQALTEEANLAKQRLNLAKAEVGMANLEEKEEKRRDREQKKREKDREKATKDFFRQIENGFSFTAKAFTGAILGGGIAGYVTGKAAQHVATSNLLAQFNIDAETAQRYQNVFRIGSGNVIGDEQTNAILSQLSLAVGNKEGYNPTALNALVRLGIEPGSISSADDLLKKIRERTKKEYDPKVLSSLMEGLGLGFSPAFTQVLNSKQFSDKDWNAAWNRSVLSQEQVDANKRVAVEIGNVIKQFNNLTGVLIDKFEPAIKRITDYVQENLNTDNASKLAEYTAVVLGGLGLSKGYKFAARNPVLAGGLAAYVATDLTSSYLQKHPIEGKMGMMNKVMQYYLRNGLADKRTSNNKDSMYAAPTFEGDEALSGLNAFNTPYMKDFANTEGRAAFKSSNINVVTNINAGSVDSSSVPSLVNGVVNGVEGAVQQDNIYDSKYTIKSRFH